MTAIKRCCALALAVLMILTALPVTAFAETAAHETNASLHETTLDGIALRRDGCARDQRLSP